MSTLFGFDLPFSNGPPHPSLYPHPPTVTWLKEILLTFPRQGVEWDKVCREEGEEGQAAGYGATEGVLVASGRKLLRNWRTAPMPPVAYALKLGRRIASKTKNVKGVPKVGPKFSMKRDGKTCKDLDGE